MCNPAAGRKLLVEKSDDAIIGHCQRDVRSVVDRRLGQVRLGPGYTAVRRAAHMERIDVALRPWSAQPTYTVELLLGSTAMERVEPIRS